MAEGNDNGSPNGGRRRSLPNPFGRIVEAVVPNVVHAIDVDDVVNQIDVDALITRVDVDGLVARVDMDGLIARVDIDALMARVDVNALLARVDTDELLSTVDINALVARVDANQLLSTIDVNALVARVDANQLLSTVDIDALLARVDANELLARIDIDVLARRLDLDALLARVDVNGIVGRVDMDAVLARVDLDAVIDRVDVDHIMQRADIAGIVARSTRGITASTIDLVRRQIAGIDELLTRVAARVARRDPDTDPDAPPALQLAAASAAAEVPTARPYRKPEPPSISGHYAGPVARTAALTIDMFAVVFMFGMVTAIVNWTIDLILRRDETYVLAAPLATTLLVLWTFAYYTVPLAIAGRTLGKAIVGLRVVTREGQPLRARQAVVRVLVLPFSFALLGLGLVGAVFGRERRALHDLAAGSAEVIDWGDRSAALPSPISRWLEQRGSRTSAENASTPTS